MCYCSSGCHLHFLFRGDCWIKSPFTNEDENAGPNEDENAGSKNENEGSKNAGSNEGGDEGGTWAWSPFST